MNCVYIETSAVLSWLLGEPPAPRVIECMDGADHIVSSCITRLEVERSLLRAESAGFIKTADRQKVRGLFMSFSSSWTFLAITVEVLSRASVAFPVEPVRSLDAIHLASVLEFIPLYPGISVLSFDNRIRANLEPLGISAATITSVP